MKKQDVLGALRYIADMARERKFSTPWCILNTMSTGGIRAYMNAGYARIGTYVKTDEPLQPFSITVNSIQLEDALKSLRGIDVAFKVESSNVVVQSNKQRVTLPIQSMDEAEERAMDPFFADGDFGNLIGEFEGRFINTLFGFAKKNKGAIYFDEQFISMVPFMGAGLCERRPRNVLYYKLPCSVQCSIHIFISQALSFPSDSVVKVFAKDPNIVNLIVPGTRISFERLEKVEQARPDRTLYAIDDLKSVGHAAMPDKVVERFGSDIIEWRSDGTVSSGTPDAEYTQEIEGQILQDFKTGVQLIKDGEYDIYDHPQFIRFENDLVVMISGKIRD